MSVASRAIILILLMAGPVSASPPPSYTKLFAVPKLPPASELTKEAEQKIKRERACIMTLPWPKTVDTERHDLWGLKSETYRDMLTAVGGWEVGHKEKIADKGLRQVAPTVLDLGEKDGPYPMGKLIVLEMLEKEGMDGSAALYVTRRLAGQDAEQVRLYIKYLYVKALYFEGNYSDLIKTVSAERTAGWIISPTPLDAAPYFTDQSLRNFITRFEFAARARSMSVAASESERVNFVADYLAARPSLEMPDGVISLVGDLTALCLSVLKPTDLAFNTESPDIGQQLTRVPQVAGVMKSRSGRTVYLGTGRLDAIALVGRRWRLLSPDQAAAGLDSHCRETVTTRSTPDMLLFNVSRDADGYEIEFPTGRVRLALAEATQLGEGKPLPPDHELTKALTNGGSDFVLYANPLMLKPGRWVAEGDDITFRLQRAYPGSKVYRDPLTEKTESRTKGLTARQLGGKDDMVVVVDDQVYGVKDGNVIANLSVKGGPLEVAGIRVVRFNGETTDPRWAGPRGKQVFVITGRVDAALATYVRALGDAGYLQGNTVLFAACGTPLGRELATEITGKYEAEAVFCFEGLIPGNDVGKVFRDLAVAVGGADAGSRPNLAEFWQRVVRSRGLNGVWQVSWAEPQRPIGSVHHAAV